MSSFLYIEIRSVISIIRCMLAANLYDHSITRFLYATFRMVAGGNNHFLFKSKKLRKTTKNPIPCRLSREDCCIELKSQDSNVYFDVLDLSTIVVLAYTLFKHVWINLCQFI